MKDIKTDSSSIVIPLAQERIYKGNKDKAVLLVHGYTGTPHDMDYLAQEINQKTDYSVFVPRLPGHGTNSSDYRQSSARDYIRKVYDSYLNLKDQYNTVHVGGLSMGGLLAILTASRFKVKKLFLIAAAIYTHNKLLPFTPILKYIIPVIKNKSEDENIQEKYSTEDKLKLYNNYYKYTYTAQVAELYKLMRLARKKLKTVTSDTLILTSRNDRLVPMKAAYAIEQKLSSSNTEMIIFDKSPHAINKGPEKEYCAEKIIEFLLQ
ncbi:MAG: alpha/beta hydrolase [Halanaerobiales bacterium]